MDLAKVLHMKGGVGETSYAKNSLFQQKLTSLSKPLRDKAITNLYCSTLPISLAIADLGCSSGPNTLLVISEIIKVVEKLCRELNHKSPEYAIFLNDLPGNDFNSVFESLDAFKKKLCDEIESKMCDCYFSGVPGSFYGRIFPNKSLHFVHSSFSLHFLSKVPEGIDNNKGNIFMASTSPTNVLKAYYEQYQTDFSLFLKCRSQELVQGGRMVLTFMGRKSDNQSEDFVSYAWELMAMILNDMVLEGIIEEEKFNTFNMPLYQPSPSEVKMEVVKEGSFAIDQLEVFELNKVLDNWDAMGQSIRAGIEPMLVSHFGEGVIEEVFSRFRKSFIQIPKERTKSINLTVSLIRKP